jgi:hypothetical protein
MGSSPIAAADSVGQGECANSRAGFVGRLTAAATGPTRA